MISKVAFYSRCKPQESDAIELALATKRIFIGYPMAKPGVAYNPRNLHSCMVDPSCELQEWLAWHPLSSKSPQFNRNRNLIARVTEGSIAMIPRPSLGVIFCGRISKPFCLEDNPGWYDDYLALREKQGLTATDSDQTWHAADIAQGWEVDEFHAIPVPRIPAWIRKSMFGRSTYGVIPLQDGIESDPHSVLMEIIRSPGFASRSWTSDVEEVERRLLIDLTPSTFEHLVVSLLQLEHPHEVWTQVGGSGDGGIDGVGANADGTVAGLLQCKWQYWGEDVFERKSPWGIVDPSRRYLATLVHPKNVVIPEHSTLLNRRVVAQLMIKHSERLPLAISMRVERATRSR